MNEWMNQVQLQTALHPRFSRLSIGFYGKALASSSLQPVALGATGCRMQYQLTVSVSVLERLEKPCKNNATCQTSFTDNWYRCLYHWV